MATASSPSSPPPWHVRLNAAQARAIHSEDLSAFFRPEDLASALEGQQVDINIRLIARTFLSRCEVDDLSAVPTAQKVQQLLSFLREIKISVAADMPRAWLIGSRAPATNEPLECNGAIALYAYLATTSSTTAAGAATGNGPLQLVAGGLQACDLKLYERAHTIKAPAVRDLLVALANRVLEHANIARLLVPSDAPARDRRDNANHLTRLFQVALSDMVSGGGLWSPARSLSAVADLLNLVPALQGMSGERGFTRLVEDLQKLDDSENHAKIMGCIIAAQYLHAKTGASKIDPYKIPVLKGLEVLGTGVEAVNSVSPLGSTGPAGSGPVIPRGYVRSMLGGVMSSVGSFIFTPFIYSETMLNRISNSKGSLSKILKNSSKFIDNTIQITQWLTNSPAPDRTLKCWDEELKNHIGWTGTSAEVEKNRIFRYYVTTYARASLGESMDLMSAVDLAGVFVPRADAPYLVRSEINSTEELT